MKTPEIYVDLANGLRHGLYTSVHARLSVEARDVVRDFLRNEKLFSSTHAELLQVRERYLKTHEFEVSNYDEFEYGFWLGIFNGQTMNEPQ